jgi:radical SAM protein with 4Fe4S-binding SPASM domain
MTPLPNHSLPSRIGFPKGLFTRTYTIRENRRASVAYHTPSQAMAFLEDDSAAIWDLLYRAHGRFQPALDYMLQRGTWEGNPEQEARAALAAFVEHLWQGQLVQIPGIAPAPRPNVPARRQAYDVAQDPDVQVAQVMADHHICYGLVLETTYRCNERCVHCYLPDQTNLRELSLPQIDALLGEFASLGGFAIQLTGGETLVRRDFASILALVKKHRLMPSIVSNLTLLQDEVLQAIADAYPKSVGCSIYSARPELHDAVTRLPGSFQRSIRAVRLLRERGVPVIIKTPLLKDTAPHWSEIPKLAAELGVEYQLDLSITAKNDGGLSPLAQRVEDPALLREIFSAEFYHLYVRDESMAQLAATPSPDASLCGAGAAGLAISPDGTIRPCIGLTTPLGHFPEDSLSWVWNESPFFHEFGAIRLRDITPCRDCADLMYCSRCPGAWQAERGDFRHPSPYTCTLAKAWAATQRACPPATFFNPKVEQRKGGEDL